MSTDLLDIVEPDDEQFLAAERREETHMLQRAMVVLVRDHVPCDNRLDEITAELLSEGGFHVDACVTVKNKKSQIRKAIETAVVGGVDLVLTFGGVGVGPRDKTAEATLTVLDQPVAGVAEALRASALIQGILAGALSVGVAGVSGSTLVVNIAAEDSAARDGINTLIPLAHSLVEQLQGIDLG